MNNELILGKKINEIKNFQIYTYFEANNKVVRKCIINEKWSGYDQIKVFNKFKFISGNYFILNNNKKKCEAIIFNEIPDDWFYGIVNLIINVKSKNLYDFIFHLKNFFLIKKDVYTQQIGIMTELIFAYFLCEHNIKYLASVYKKSQYDFSILKDNSNKKINIDIKGGFLSKETCTINHYPNYNKNIDLFILILLPKGNLSIYDLLLLLKNKKNKSNNDIIDKTQKWIDINKNNMKNEFKVSLDISSIYYDKDRIKKFNINIDNIINNDKNLFVWLNSINYIVNIDAFKKIKIKKLQDFFLEMLK